jgi:hypothetical protein
MDAGIPFPVLMEGELFQKIGKIVIFFIERLLGKKLADICQALIQALLNQLGRTACCMTKLVDTQSYL